MSEVVLRAVVGRPVQRVADLHLLRFGNDSVDKLVMDALLHVYTAGSDTVLAFVEEDTAECLQRVTTHNSQCTRRRMRAAYLLGTI